MRNNKISAIDEAVSDFNHDLRNSLTVILGNLEFIKKGKKDKTLYIKKIEESVKEILTKLIRFKKAVSKKTKD